MPRRCLVADPSTLAALQIVQQERHASQMGIGKPKEGFSMLGLLQRCVTQMVGGIACETCGLLVWHYS